MDRIIARMRSLVASAHVEQLGQLDQLDVHTLEALETALAEAYEQHRESAAVDQLAALVDAVKAVRVAAFDAERDPDAAAADDAPDAPDEPARQAATARRPSIADVSARRPDSGRPRGREPSSSVLLAAGGDLADQPTGARLEPTEFARAWRDGVAQFRRTGRTGSYRMATARAEYPEELRLGMDADENTRRIRAVTDRLAEQDMDALVAAGGLCAPTAPRYDVFGVGTDRRPIRDGLPRFQADRGGIRFIAPPSLASVNTDTDGTYAAGDDTAVVLWTEATDTSPGSNVKPVQTIACGSETEVTVDAIPLRMQFGNFQAKANPEHVAEWWRLGRVAHARVAEDRLWDRMAALSTAVTTGQQLGAARDALENLDQAAVSYRSRHRMDPEAPMVAVVPDWLVGLIRADLTRQSPGDQTLGVTRDQIAAYLRARDLEPIFAADGQEFGAQAAGALNGWPLTLEAIVFPPGTFIHLDGGELDFGTEIRDTTMLDTNDVQGFYESFEGVARVGVESLHVTMTVCPDGSASALTAIDPCTTGS